MANSVKPTASRRDLPVEADPVHAAVAALPLSDDISPNRDLSSTRYRCTQRRRPQGFDAPLQIQNRGLRHHWTQLDTQSVFWAEICRFTRLTRELAREVLTRERAFSRFLVSLSTSSSAPERRAAALARDFP